LAFFLFSSRDLSCIVPLCYVFPTCPHLHHLRSLCPRKGGLFSREFLLSEIYCTSFFPPYLVFLSSVFGSSSWRRGTNLETDLPVESARSGLRFFLFPDFKLSGARGCLSISPFSPHPPALRDDFPAKIRSTFPPLSHSELFFSPPGLFFYRLVTETFFFLSSDCLEARIFLRCLASLDDSQTPPKDLDVPFPSYV